MNTIHFISRPDFREQFGGSIFKYGGKATDRKAFNTENRALELNLERRSFVGKYQNTFDLLAVTNRIYHRVGGGITSAVLPHHRAYGSVHGGSR